jgi:hypothetical protein
MDRYLAAKWKILHCPQCGERACAQPLLMIGLYFLYLWDIILFGALAFLDQSWIYLGVMIGGWLILDYFSLYLPLSPLRRPHNM